MFWSPANPFISVIADVCILFFFFVFGLGSVGALSSIAEGFRVLSKYEGTSGIGSLGQATLALGWLLVFIILGTLIYEVYYVLRNYGKDMGVWRQSFHDLTTGGVPRSEKPSAAPVASSAV
jgi:TRAP-type C4-dicarboxylate transport system permease small subunit